MNEDLKKGNKSAENRIESIRPATLKEILAIPVVKKYIETAITKARYSGIDETVDFMKGKVIDMPVGSGMPLVVKESFVRKTVKLLTQKK